MIIVALLSLKCISWYDSKKYVQFNDNNEIYVLIIFLILFIGLRPVGWGYFGDSAFTWHIYENIYKYVPFSFNYETANLVYDNLLAFFASLDLGLSFFFLICAAIYFGASFVGIKKLFPRHYVAVYLMYLGAFSTYSYAVNGVKAGTAASLFIMALGYSRHWIICVPLMMLSYGIHHSMHVPIIAYILTCFFKNPKVYFAGWFLCFLMALCHVTVFQNLFSEMTDKTGAEYLTGNRAGAFALYADRGGFRPDFILYSFMPIWVGYIAIYKKKIYSPTYNTLLCLYLTTNALWLLCMYALYTNRIAYLSWFLYPIVLIYPIFLPQWGENRFQLIAKIMLAHLSFTLFMNFIYY